MSEAFEGYSPGNAANPRWIDLTEILVGGRSELDVLDRLVEDKALDGSDRQIRNLIHDKLKRITAVCEFQFSVEIIRDDDLEVVVAEVAVARMAWKIPGIAVATGRSRFTGLKAFWSRPAEEIAAGSSWPMLFSDTWVHRKRRSTRISARSGRGAATSSY